MSVDLSKLSSKELFELAKQREKEEHEASKRRERLNETIEQREELIARHNEKLAATEAAISELEQERDRLVSAFETSIAPLDREIADLEKAVLEDEANAEQAREAHDEAMTAKPATPPSPPRPQTPPPQPPSFKPAQTVAPGIQNAATIPATHSSPAATPPIAHKPSAPAGSSLDDLYNLIRGMLRNRTYISESLMKEKLKSAGYDLANFRHQIEQLVQDKRVDHKGRGNYALGRRK